MLDSKIFYIPTLLALVIALSTTSAVAKDSEKVAPQTRPEDKRTSIPDDTFTPSESVSEDYPVPFPTDI